MSIWAGRLSPVLCSSYIERALTWEYRRFSAWYVSQMPCDRCSSSRAPVQTCWPFLAMMVAVPVSWQTGSTPMAAISALRIRASATPRSLSETSGSERIAATCSL